MKKKDALPYVYDFARILAGKTDGKAKDIILFGSVARGTFDRESDVDIFVNVPKGKMAAVQKAVDSAQNEFEIYTERTWKLQGMDLPIKCIVGDLDSPRWSELKREIISSGISLYGKYKELPDELKHYFIFSFNLARLKSKDMVATVRKIYGYSTKKGEKTYKHGGLLDDVGGEKMNPGIIMVPVDSYKKVYDFFRASKISFRIREIWTE